MYRADGRHLFAVQENTPMKLATVSIGLCSFLIMVAPATAGPDDDKGSVYDYAINWAVQTGANEITVQAQARYCSACNPNWSGNPGCVAFKQGPPPYGHVYCADWYPDGTYIACRIMDSGGGVLGTQKLILQSGVNFTLNVVCKWQFLFGGLSLSAGDSVTVEVDTYCSWCGHWYPNPITIDVQGADAQITYTGDLSGLVGQAVTVSAHLEDVATGDALSGETVTFTLNPVAPIATVSAVTDSSGIATASMLIPAATPGGVYTMDTRFAGNAAYFPCSDQDPFEVIVNRPPQIDCVNPVVLWSPDHELVDLSAAISVHDPDPQDTVTLSFRVMSDETETPDTGDGSGRFAPDFKNEYPAGRGLLMRSERRGTGDGRFYLIGIKADDGNGGISTGVCVAAVVPHDESSDSLQAVLDQAAAALSLFNQTLIDELMAAVPGTALPAAVSHLYEHGVSAPLGPKQ